MLQALPRAADGLACLASRLVVERLVRRREVGLGALQFLVQGLRHANVLLLVALQFALQLLLLPLRLALGGLALFFGLAPHGFVLALRLLLLPLRLAHRLFVLLHGLAVRLLVLAHGLFVLLDGLFVLPLGFELRLAHRLFVLLHCLAMCLFVLPLCFARFLFVPLHRLAVRLLVLALPQLILALAFLLRLDVLALASCLRLGQRLAHLLQLAFGLRELGVGRFDARRGAFDQLEGVLRDGLGSGDDGGEDTQGTADKGAGEH